MEKSKPTDEKSAQGPGGHLNCGYDAIIKKRGKRGKKKERKRGRKGRKREERKREGG